MKVQKHKVKWYKSINWYNVFWIIDILLVMLLVGFIIAIVKGV